MKVFTAMWLVIATLTYFQSKSEISGNSLKWKNVTKYVWKQLKSLKVAKSEDEKLAISSKDGGKNGIEDCNECGGN